MTPPWCSASRRRRDQRRQDQPRRVRHGLVHRELGVRPHPQPPRPRAGARWFLGRFGRCGGLGHGAPGARLGHRRLDPPARLPVRPGGREAHLRHRLPPRPGRLRLVARPDRSVRRHRRRRRAAARGDRRARPGRLDVAPPARPRGQRPPGRRRRRPAGRHHRRADGRGHRPRGGRPHPGRRRGAGGRRRHGGGGVGPVDHRRACRPTTWSPRPRRPPTCPATTACATAIGWRRPTSPT
jgi:hypothetical protein